MSKNKFYFSHDSGARNDDKIIAVRMKLKAEGYAVYFMILEKLLECTNYMSVKDYNVLAFDFRVGANVVKSVIEDFGLFEFTEDGKYFYSTKFNDRMKPLDKMREQRSEAGKKSAEKRANQQKINENPTTVERPMGEISTKEKIRDNIYNNTTNVDIINICENENFEFSEIREVWENFSGKRNSFEKDLKKFLEKTEGLNIDFEKLKSESKNVNDIYFQSWLNQKFPKSSKKVAQKKVSFSKEEFKNTLLELGAIESHIEDWFKVRISKRAQFTETALQAFLNECNKNNFPVTDAVRICAERSWQGFKYQWIINENQRNATGQLPQQPFASSTKEPYFFDRERAMQALTGQNAGGISEN